MLSNLSLDERIDLEQTIIEEERRLARTGMLDFTTYIKKDYRVNWHHELICDYLDKFVSGEIKKLMIFTAPRHGKSELVSRKLPAFLFGQNPNAQLISCSYSSDLASMFNRDVQRTIDTPEYAELFPETRLNSANVRANGQGQAVRNSDQFEIVGYSGFYKSAGVGGGITGLGATHCIIDDPVRNAQDAASPTMRQNVWEWYQSTLYTRLMRERQVLLTLCMTGDTPVLMADGKERMLSNLRAGDIIATYDSGKVSTSTVRKWKCQGPDFVFEIKTRSGRTVKANERHPFLVCRNGEMQWVRLKDLRVGENLIRVGADGRASNAILMDAKSQPFARGIAALTTTNSYGHQDTGHPQLIMKTEEGGSYATDTELSRKITPEFSMIKKKNVQFAKNLQSQELICPSTGGKCASITVTKQIKLEDFCATNATSLSDTALQKKSCYQPLNIYEPILDSIVEISPVGIEDVYDIQVDRTENFIANGLVSHNTRWHEDDLAGRLLALAKEDPDADQWTVLNLPARFESIGAHPNDPRKEGEALWESDFGEKVLNSIKASVGSRVWTSLYQQRPAPDEGDIVKKEWWRFWTVLPEFDELVQSWDLTFKKGEQSDYTVGQVWGRKGPDKYLIDQFRNRMGFNEQVSAIKNMKAKWPNCNAIYIEDAANASAVKDVLTKEISGIVLVPTEGNSKITRAQAVAPQIEAGNVFLPPVEGNTWVKDFIEEWGNFPNSSHDDSVDATTQALKKLSEHKVYDWEPVSITKQSTWR